jgi:DNA excision repair protein ERCC-2
VPTFIDLEARRIQVGVSDLLGENEKRTIGLSGAGRSRLWIGQELHRRVQSEISATEEGYRAEVIVSLEIEIDSWTVEINGRADGVAFRDEKPIRVDEIKTLHFAVDLYNLYSQERLDRFRDQARLYALMLSTDDQKPDVRLILVDIVSGEEKSESVPWSQDSVLSWLRQRVHRLISREKNRIAHITALREASADLRFPFDEPRPVQNSIVEAVEDSLGAGRHLLIRAPTGCGKTAAALYPTLKTAMKKGHRLFFLTAKTLQQRIAVQTAQLMQPGGFRSIQLRAKGKMCAHTEKICHEEHCPYAAEYGVKLVHSHLLDNLLDGSPHLDPDEIFDAGKQHEVCPFEVSLDLLRDTDLVICDYNYVFDPTVGLCAVLGGNALENGILVIDEAHNLVDRSRGYYSPILSAKTAVRAVAFCSRRDNRLFERLGLCVNELSSLIESSVNEVLEGAGPGENRVCFPIDELRSLRIDLDSLLLQYFIFKRENDLWIADDPVMDIFLELVRFQRVLELDGDEFVHLARRTPDGDHQLCIFCLDASRFVGNIIDLSAGTVAMSATLEPFEFYRDLLGFDQPRTDTLRVRSPFPAENRLVLAIDDVNTTYRRRAESYDRIAFWLSKLIAPERNALVLFPSYAFLRSVEDRLPPMRHRILCQEQGSTDSDQREMLSALQNGSSNVVLAVLGGIFAEGVDYPGDMLSQVVVVSPGLPQFNLERELLKAYYQERHGHGFGYAYLIPGMTRVVQAAGRLIRSADDRGVIVLMGKRFLDGQYAKLLPEEWLDDSVESLLHPDPQRAVLEFFGQPSDSR